MGKNSYNGGGTIVHAGSGFFSHKGGPGRRRKTVEGADEPGEAKPGSICDFRSIRPRKKKVIEFQTKTKEQRSAEKRESEVKRLRTRAKQLIDKTAKAAQQVENQIVSLRSALKKAEIEKTKLNSALLYARGIDLQSEELAGVVKKLNEFLQGVSVSISAHPQKGKKKKLKISAKNNRASKKV